MVLEPAKRLRAFGVLILYDSQSNFFTSYIWAAITVFTISNMVAIPPVNKCHKIISGRWLQFTVALCKTEANNMRFAKASGLKREHICYSMNPVMINSGTNGPTCRISSYTYSLAISAKVMEVVQTPSINKEALLQRPREGRLRGE